MRKICKAIAATALLMALVAVTGSCTKDNNVTKTDVLRLEINSDALLIDLRSDDGEEFDVVSLNTEFPTECLVENAAEFQTLTIGGADATEGSCSFQLKGISEGERIPIVFDNGNYSGTAYIRTRNSQIPSFVTSGTPVGGVDYYLSFVYIPLALKLDNQGNIVFYHIDRMSIALMLKENAGIWDFKKHVVDGKTYYSYHESDPDYVSLMANGFNPGRRVLLDEHYQIIDKFKLLASDGITEGQAIDGHDFYFFSPTHYIMSAYLDKKLSDSDFPEGVEHKDGGCNVLAAYLQEVKDGHVVFEWWSTDHPELISYGDTKAFPAENFDYFNSVNTRPDYVHFNSMDIDSEGNLICSFRHISSLLKIDRAGGSGSILWRLSGAGDDFGLSADEKTCGQHFARLSEDNVITLFDNGNASGHTRYRRFTLDQKAMTATSSFCDAPDGYFSQACGSVAINSDGSYTAGCGVGADMSNIRWLVELDATGHERFAITQSGKNVLSYTYRVVNAE